MRHAKTARLLYITAGALALLSCASPANEPRVPRRDTFIARALYAKDRVWLLTDTGDLSSIGAGESTRRGAGLSELVLDACVVGGELEVLTCDGACDEWHLVALKDGRWLASTAVPSLGDRVLGLSCAPGAQTIVSNRRAIEIANGKASSVALSERLQTQNVASLHVADANIFVGFNAGEWGGGLRRIDRKTGNVSIVEKNATGELCGGPLNAACDPVNGIADEPWRSGCIAIAVGLIHFSAKGRIVEVCESEVRELYAKTSGASDASARHDERNEPAGTVAFFGLARSGQELLAAGTDGLYRFDGSATPKITPLPKFQVIDGVALSFEIPDVVLVLTASNRRHSISGNVPLLVPR